MGTYTISAIQQIGVGTMDFRRSWDWYIDTLGFDVKILEDDTVAERMLPYTGNQAQKRHACIAVNMQGGSGLEIWQYSERKPQPCAFDIMVADTGVFAAKIKCLDVKRFHKELTDKNIVCSNITVDPAGTPCFFMNDPFGNSFQIIGRKDVFIGSGRLCGGVIGAMTGVRDMQRSIAFYRDILGYDTVVYDVNGKFDDWSIMPGADELYRRVLLARSQEPSGPFAGLLGSNTIELVQALDRSPRKIFEGRYWGDPGFIQLCYDVTGMDALKEFCAAKGHPFTVDSCPNGERFDMGQASGRFTYIEDPDGSLIEFVETHKIPLAAKLGLYLNLDRRKSSKPLPKFLFRIMNTISKQK